MDTTQEINAGQMISDEEAIRRVLAGEGRLYEVIMRRYNARLYRIGMSIVNNETEVEDIMQVAYIKAYEHLHTFNHKSAFGTWLTRILINESLLHLKKSKRYTAMESDNRTNQVVTAVSSESTPAKALLNKELGRILEDALIQIPEKYRMVFVMREIENMSVAETVDSLNISEANVKVRLNRAKTMLRDTLSDYYKSDGIYEFHLTRCDRIVNKVFARLGIAIVP